MPQLDPTSFPSQLFWLTVTFLFLYLTLARFIVPKLAQILANRQGRLDGDLAAAQRFHEEAEAARTSYEKSLADTRKEAQTLIADAQNKSSAEMVNRLNALNQDMVKRLADAEKSIAGARDKALADMAPVVSGLVAQICEKITSFKPNQQQIDGAVQSVTGK